MEQALSSPKEVRSEFENRIAIRFEKLVPEILSSLGKITGRVTCPDCKNIKKCPHLNSHKGWNTWWRKHGKNFKVRDE